MKKVKLFSFALAALMLGACTNEDVIDNGGQTVLPGEKGYISLGINLPTTPSSRAANDNFGDGLAAEYAVDDATLIVLEGASEGAATVTGVYTLQLPDATNVGTNTDNITTSYQLTQKIKKPSANNNLYALVVLNKGNALAEDTNTYTGKKLEDFMTTIIDESNTLINSNSHILMTNAPLYTTPGGTTNPDGGKVVTLTEINPENVFTTEAEAKANPAANIYVERALAKVTVTQGSAYSSGNGTFTSASIEGWTLDVTNKVSYLVRNMVGANWWSYNASTATSPEVGAANDYRFVGSVPVSAGLYRTYWGVDPNYSGYSAVDFNNLNGTTPTSLTSVGELSAMYCKENTFNVANQNQNQTTRVIVAAKLKFDGETADATGTFYTFDNNKDVIYNTENIQNLVKKYFIENENVSNVLKDKLNPGTQDVASVLEVSFDKTAGDVKVANITFKDGAGTLFKEGSVPTELQNGGEAYSAALTEINSHVYSCYADGIAYYPVMIKHFGDDLTPWSADNKTESYPDPDAEAKWLGRYGVLRNNWYNIEVTSIKSIGSADVPDPYGVPDDPVESWISVKINVLSWAKRSQSVGL